MISGNTSGSVFINICDFKQLAGTFHFRNTKTFRKFELKCLMSSTFNVFTQMSSKSSHSSSFANEPYARKFHRYRCLGKGKLRPWKFYTLITALIRLVIFQIHIFELKGRYTYDVHENCPNHLSSYIQNSSTPLTLNVQFQTNPPHHSKL